MCWHVLACAGVCRRMSLNELGYLEGYLEVAVVILHAVVFVYRIDVQVVNCVVVSCSKKTEYTRWCLCTIQVNRLYTVLQ